MSTGANPRYANGSRRRALRARILATETHCGICGEPVDTTIPTPHPDSPEIDEIHPLSKGGDPLSRSNCQLTHRRCNRAKSDTTPGDHRQFETDRTW
ncbi:HNH endonuclease [Williamsia phyllosphaerae]